MNIALIGYGKMGHMIESICKERGHNIVSIIDVDNQDDFESAAFASADVAIEFTSPTAAYSNYLRAYLSIFHPTDNHCLTRICTYHVTTPDSLVC